LDKNNNLTDSKKYSDYYKKKIVSKKIIKEVMENSNLKNNQNFVLSQRKKFYILNILYNKFI
jgi:hypothetical protein